MTDLPATVTDALAAAACHRRVGITLLPEREELPEEHRTYAELYHDARAAAGGLAKIGVSKGDPVLLVLPTSYEFVIGFFGSLLVGAVPVPAYPPAGLRIGAALERLGRIAAQARIRTCILGPGMRGLAGDLALRAGSLEQVASVDQLCAGASRYEAPAILSQHPALVQYTSGSTGRPKGVLLSHANLLANVRSIGQAVRVSSEDVVVSWLPMYHDMGLIGTLLFTMYWKLPLVLLSPTAFIRRPVRWLRAIHRHRGTLSPAPNFGYALCVSRVTEAERVGLDLSSWRSAMNGGEPVSARTLEDFERTYAPHGFRPEAALPVYGLAEGSLAATFPTLGARPKMLSVDRSRLSLGIARPDTGANAVRVVSVGRAVPGHLVQVVGPNGVPLPENEVGEIAVRGPSVMQGYYRNPRESADRLRAGWLWTGDLGFMSGGELYVTGRAKDLIIIRGRNFYAEDLERASETVPGVRQGGCVALGINDGSGSGDRLVLVCETRLTDVNALTELERKLRETLLEQCEVSAYQVVLVEPRTIPLTSSGKRQRSQCRELYLRRALMRPRQTKLGPMVLAVRSQAGEAWLRAKRWLRPIRIAEEHPSRLSDEFDLKADPEILGSFLLRMFIRSSSTTSSTR